MLVGYMRVSTDGDRQVLDLQRDALLAVGVDERHLSKITPAAAGGIAPAWRRPWRSSGHAIASRYGSWTVSADLCPTCSRR